MKQIPCEICAMRSMGLFCHLSPADQGLCNQHKTVNVYKQGQILFYEGNHPLGVYCMFAGKIKLYKTGAGGRLQIVRLSEQGDLLGYRALLANEAYSATAEVLEEAIVCFVEKSTFFQILGQNSALSMAMMKKIAQELGQAENHIVDVAQKSTRERLAGLLMTLNEAYGKPCDGGTEIGIALSREDMAEMIGTTQETVIRLLSEFRTDGIIDVNGRAITLRQINLLKAMIK